MSVETSFRWLDHVVFGATLARTAVPAMRERSWHALISRALVL
jgi:hypothetical protein